MILRVLIVEDDATKAERVRNLVDTGLAEAVHWTVARSSAEARLALTEAEFDVLVLDIVLPRFVGAECDEDEGAELLAELLSDDSGLHAPLHIIGLTAYPERLDAAREYFETQALTILQYDVADDAWLRPLVARLRHVQMYQRTAGQATPQFGCLAVVVCALASPELDTVLRLPLGWTQSYAPGDHTIYYRGQLSEGDGEGASSDRIYAFCLPRMGIAAAAAATMKAIGAFRPRLVVLTGIAAGIPPRARVGDVLIADPTWEWLSGKWATGAQGSVFLADPHQVPLAQGAREILRAMTGDDALLQRIQAEWTGEAPEQPLRAVLGPIASSSTVLSDEEKRALVENQNRQVVGVDMESYGVFLAAQEAPEPRPCAVCIKGVSDLADQAKGDSYRKYAAWMSAQFALEFLRRSEG